MDLLQGLLLIGVIHTLAAASPGPDFVLVTQQTLAHGKKAGLMCSMGITLGLAVHITYSAFGLAALIANSAHLLWAIKILGGGYLCYLGVKGLQAKAAGIEQQQSKPVQYSLRKSIGIGFLCNALNPKAPIYFVALFTVVLSPEMPLYQIAIYGAWMMLIQLIWFSTLVVLLSRPNINKKFKAYAHWVDRVLGGAMLGLGIKMLATRISL